MLFSLPPSKNHITHRFWSTKSFEANIKQQTYLGRFYILNLSDGFKISVLAPHISFHCMISILKGEEEIFICQK